MAGARGGGAGVSKYWVDRLRFEFVPASRSEAADHIEDLDAEIARLREALRHYEDSFCEGFCKDVPTGFTSPDMELDCSGCKARAALATAAP